jgi:hypothetical protein
VSPAPLNSTPNEIANIAALNILTSFGAIVLGLATWRK